MSSRLKRWRLVLSACALSVYALPACAPSTAPVAPDPAPEREPVRVILFIGGGVGTAHWSAARYEVGVLAVERLPVGGLMDTRSDPERVADSAAAATALSAGVRTYNGAIGVGPDSVPVRTVLQEAAARGMGTGLVATSTLTDATPAAFAAHVVDRSMKPEIARQMAEQRIDVLLGGGRGHFDGTERPDSLDLLSEMRRRYTYVETAADLEALAMDTVEALLGFFAPLHMPAAPEREPSTARMTEAALAVLDRNPRGFFLMVEGSHPDRRTHDGHRPLAEVAAEVVDFDRAVGVALDYQRDRSETLILVTAGHETGGLSLVLGPDGDLAARYTTTGQTAEMVPLFAGGPGAERFGGIIDNYRVGQALLESVRGGSVRRAGTSTIR